MIWSAKFCLAEFSARGELTDSLSPKSVLDNLDMWGVDSVTAIVSSGTLLLHSKLARSQNPQPERLGILGGLQALAASSGSGLTSTDENSTGSVVKSKAYSFAQLSNLGVPFLRSGGAATFYGDVLSTLPGYRPTITPRGIALPSGKW
jgi:hypothetical protein